MTALTANPAGNLSMETIAFQDKAFGKAVEAVFEEILASRVSPKELDTTFAPKIEALIKEKTNLTIDVRFEATFVEQIAIGPYVDVSVLFTNNHIFLPKHVRGNGFVDDGEVRERMKKIAEHKLKNTVNTRKAWVTGYFAEAEVPIVIPSAFVYTMGLTAAELTAILIHELGHAFSVCEYTNRYATTNQVLATMMHAKNLNNMDARTYIFKEAGQILTDNPKMFNDITEDITSDQAVYTIALDNVYRDMYNSASGSDCYDFSACEQAADQFVSRMGYGRHAVTGLDKAFSDPMDKSSTARHLSNFFEVLMPFIKGGTVLATSAAAGPSAAVIAGLVVLTGIGFAFLNSGERNRDHTYDTSRVRYLRLREDMLNRIKDKKIKKEHVKECLEDLAAVDKVIDTLVKSDNLSYFDIASNFIFKKNKQQLDARKLQRQLEELASNDLYRVAARLRIN